MRYFHTGTSLSLNGMPIPTDGSGRIKITDISTESSDGGLICRSSGNLDWYLHPTQQTTGESDRIMDNHDPRGWSTTKYTASNGDKVVILRRVSTGASEEGVLTCGDNSNAVSVGVYYPSELCIASQ